MLVPDEVRKCVAFVGYKNAEGMKWAGTAFFVAMQIPYTDRSFGFAVTAKHVIDGIRRKSTDKRVYLRLNFKDADASFSSTELDEWKTHPNDPSVDVAVMKFFIPGDVTDHLYFGSQDFARKDVIKNEGIDIGEEVFFAGLFYGHTGRKKNIPIIRVGNISAMPEEPVYTPEFGDIEAYLVEARSIGGLSGSPVFVHLGLVRNVDGRVQFATRKEGPYWLLGLMHGHWDVSLLEIDSPQLDDNTSEKVNVGIGVVVPAYKILEVMNQPLFVEMRRKMAEELMNAKT